MGFHGRQWKDAGGDVSLPANFREDAAICLYVALTMRRLPQPSEARYKGERKGIGAKPTVIRVGRIGRAGL